MGEIYINKPVPILDQLHEKMDTHGIERTTESLQIQATWQDPNISKAAKLELMRQWESKPEKGADKAKTVDLMEEFEKFSESERKDILSQLVAIQLTQGCNGHCSFCFTGGKKGVEAKYSFDSVVNFFEKYKGLLPKELALYWDSDVFDYRDGKHSFIDVYNYLVNKRPDLKLNITTAVPRGGEDNFIDFMMDMAQKWRRGVHPDLKVRLSVGRESIQRVESSIQKLTGVLLANKFFDYDVEAFYSDFLLVVDRFEPLKLGNLIRKHDDIRDIETVACADGVIVSPKEVKAVMVTVPNIYNKSGQAEVILQPGKNKRVPLYINWQNYREGAFSVKMRKGLLMMDIVRDSNGLEYFLNDKFDDLVFKLGREVASMGWLINDFSNFEGHEATGPWNFLGNFLEQGARVYRTRSTYTRGQLEKANNLLSSGKLSVDEIEKVEFYKLLAEVYMTEMDFLARQVEKGRSAKDITRIAARFRTVGRDNVGSLPEIIEELEKDV